MLCRRNIFKEIRKKQSVTSPGGLVREHVNFLISRSLHSTNGGSNPIRVMDEFFMVAIRTRYNSSPTTEGIQYRPESEMACR